jgi:hypothetical protein
MRRSRKALGTKPPRPGSLRELKKELESLNAQYVKLRDGMACVQCYEEGVSTAYPLDAGHLYPKSVFKATHYRVEAIFAQCRRHNTLHCSRPELFLDWYVRRHGFEALEAIHRLAVSDWRPDREWLLGMIEERKEQIAGLRLLMVA